jgi:hypothetical protein
VYKQFIIRGPATYAVKIGRNRSYVTKLQGIFLDPCDELTDAPGSLPGFAAAPYVPPPLPVNYDPTPLAGAAMKLWAQLDDDLPVRGAVDLQMPFRIWCYRAAVAAQAPPDLLERWRWQIGVWTNADRKKYDNAMQAAHATLKP